MTFSIRVTKVVAEAYKLGLSPLLVTGGHAEVYDIVGRALKAALGDAGVHHVPRLTADSARHLSESLRVTSSPIKAVVINASVPATPKSWDKVLDALEKPHAPFIVVVGNLVPRALETRCFAVPSPAKASKGGYDEDGAFSVAAWLLAVDMRSRDRMLRATQEWTPHHTELLIREVGRLIEGENTLRLELKRTGPAMLQEALIRLKQYEHSPTVGAAVGLRLVGG